MTIMTDELAANLVGRTAALEGLAQVSAMALLGPQKKRNAAEVQELNINDLVVSEYGSAARLSP